MARRQKRSLKHDARVKKEAQKLERKGWNVKADLPGYEQPKSIGTNKRIPDIEATKKGARRLLEVETKGSLVTDKRQQSTFKRSASQRKKTSYKTIVC